MGDFWGLLGASQGPSRAFWVPSEALGNYFGPFWGLLDLVGSFENFLGLSVTFWGPSGAFWDLLGYFVGLLCPFWGLLVPFRNLLGLFFTFWGTP